ncbi:hypothetical protein FH609_005635 [Streptomyces sp. 3MP-14]|uniref:Ig-like domain repeat protein n=1 Tax=Streptomyces mimosae TaxID=2586635 RepID=A0A5N6APE0_9ACTN|nr:MULTISPECIES: hypothetical protein [Streptomyces]KAB8169770.1 hypothetical protein FH607_003315 [Streptomyces mimosae]KAB8178518.1 hypothetical protein FH609_005635 [Streptomyces sp. 3MP-14]
MRRSRFPLATLAAVALAAGLAFGGAAAAHAVESPAAASSAVAPVDVTFSLLVPNAPVTFTVDGNVVGTGTTDATGQVSFSYLPEGLAPGYYRLVATTSHGISSSIGFGVR